MFFQTSLLVGIGMDFSPMLGWSLPIPEVCLCGMVLMVIGLLALGAWIWVFPRYRHYKLSDLPAIKQERERIQEQKKEELARCQKREKIASIVIIGLVVLLMVTGNWRLYPSFVYIILPPGVVLRGLRVLELGYEVDSPLFRPLRLLTGDEARRRGRCLILGGVISLIPCLLLAYLLATLEWGG